MAKLHELVGMKIPQHKRASWDLRTDSTRGHVVTALKRLLCRVPLDDLLRFMHELHIQFTLSCDAKGKHHCRLYQNWKDPEDGSVVNSIEYETGGESPMGAVRNAIAMMLVSEQGDYHEFVDSGWPDKAEP